MNKITYPNLIFATLFLFYQIFNPLLSDSVLLYAQEDCTQRIRSAEQNYYAGNFDEAIELIKSCLKQDQKSPDIQFKALKILCQAYLAKDYREAAREVVRKLLDLKPDYTPTVEQEPPPFIALVTEVREDREFPVNKSPEKTSFFEKNRSLLWIVGGGAVLIGLTAILASGSNNKKETKPLAQPPDWPEAP